MSEHKTIHTPVEADTQHLDFEDHHQSPYSLVWFLTLLGPFVLSAGLLVMLYFTHGWGYVQALLLAALAVFFFFGRFVILGGEAGGMEEATRFFTSGELALLVFYMDTMVACLLAFHIGFLFRLPYLGAKLRILMDDGKFILQSHPWMKRATFAGIVTFCIFPLAATGSVGGSIFGRLLGMSRLGTFVGVVTGSALGCAIMYFGAALINRYLDRDNPWLTIGGILFVTLVILFLNHRYRKMKAQWYANQPKAPEKSP
ncbi:small multi-drug export protein [Geoalkalibacter halelectricus]|uniref:small multi-drug export protein n=1 Tax=Geoalkalibacter halelectricus TaxID=2847045 RepID=UPI003D1E8A0C